MHKAPSVYSREHDPYGVNILGVGLEGREGEGVRGVRLTSG